MTAAGAGAGPQVRIPVEVSVHVALAGGMGVEVASGEVDLGDLMVTGPEQAGDGAGDGDGAGEPAGTAAAMERIAAAVIEIGRGLAAAARAGRFDGVPGW